MNIKRAKNEIKNTLRAYFARDAFGVYRIPPIRQRPILLMGPPGIGKTQIMEQIAEETGVGLVAYTLTHHTRQSALGLPYIDHQTFDGQEYAVTSYTMSEIIASVHREIARTGVKEGILFLDEINCISETLTPMMLQFLQCKTFGNQPLPAGWVVVAAGNPPEYNKSVREFDVVTLDRVKRIDVEEDFAVWKEYAYRRGIHGAILSYLEIRREHFYRVEATADGMQFVTARGWEDLSELMQVYESLGLPVDRQVVGQYLQLPRVASDFAGYLQLYEKYKRVYRVDEVLNGTWEPLRASELAGAPFDEKLGVLSLLLTRLADSARELYRLDALTDALHGDLTAIRDGSATLDALLDDRQAALTRRRAAGSTDRDALLTATREIERLEAFRTHLRQQSIPAAQAFDCLKALFAADVQSRAAAVEQTDAQIANAFAFLDAAIPDSQELVLFATELTANFFTSWFIQNFGSEAYFAHNKRLLFDDTHQQLTEAIEQARQQI
ncbi:ATP-binding protein [Agathobaculum desmolans]|uniref:ATP-binding protein n=1 Tax=Agathobaculum desmolans TaxID=39484 RepID=UPI0004E22550|nr:AAA family ATPase [Agathobaculum desmolans]